MSISLIQRASLVGLPQVLRNLIYTYVIDSIEVVHIRDDKTGIHPLARTCRTLRNEFLPILKSDVPTSTRIKSIQATVESFSYVPLLALWQRLRRSRLSMHITLALSDHIDARRNTPPLREWCELMDKLQRTASPAVHDHHVVVKEEMMDASRSGDAASGVREICRGREMTRIDVADRPDLLCRKIGRTLFLEQSSDGRQYAQGLSWLILDAHCRCGLLDGDWEERVA